MKFLPPRSGRWLLAATVVALQACGGGGDERAIATAVPNPPVVPAVPPVPTAPAQLDAASSCSIPGLRESVLLHVNRARADGHVCGTELMPPVAALSWNDTLFSAAARHSLDMAVRHYFSHVTPEGIDFSQRLATEGYGAWAAGENIAAGQGSVPEVMATWLASEGHCRNLMRPVFTEVAVACVSQPGSAFGTYWTMELGRR